jgi:molecular chaperone DnaK (HSP70)
VVSQGAAIYARNLRSPHLTRKNIVIDTIASRVSVGTIGDFTEQVIAANSPLPTEIKRVFETTKDNQEKLSLAIFDGRTALASTLVPLGEFTVNHLPPRKKGELKIELTFEVNVDGLVNIALAENTSLSGVDCNLHKAMMIPREKTSESELFEFKISS